jgi:hypothetical protein
MAIQINRKSSLAPVEPSLLEWAEYWYPISWKGVLAAGVLTALGACLTIAFLLLQWRTTTLREEHTEWRTASLELETAKAKAELGTAQADIAKANAEIATAHERTAEFDARTKEAELKLEELRRQVQPRFLTPNFASALVGHPKAHVKISYVRDAADGYTFGGQIYATLLIEGCQLNCRNPFRPLPPPKIAL